MSKPLGKLSISSTNLEVQANLIEMVRRYQRYHERGGGEEEEEGGGQIGAAIIGIRVQNEENHTMSEFFSS